MELQTPTTIEDIKGILNYGYYQSRQEAFGDSKAQQIIIGPAAYMQAPDDYNPERPVVGQLLFHNDIASAQGQELDPDLDTLELLITLPFEVPEKKQRELFQVMNIFNNLVPLGAFTINTQGRVYYRYKWQIYQREVSGLALLEILSQAYFFVDRLGYKFEALASGKQSLIELMNEKIELLPVSLDAETAK